MLTLILFTFATPIQAKILKKLGKRAEKAAVQKVENRVNGEISKKTDFGNGGPTNTTSPSGGNRNTNASSVPLGPRTLKFYPNFDFVPEDGVILYDDFSVDNISDFPANWNTYGSGKVVSLHTSPENWLKFSGIGIQM